MDKVKRLGLLMFSILLFSSTASAGAAVRPTLLESATLPGAAWTLTTLDATGDVGRYASIALDPQSEVPNIAYYDASFGGVRLIHYDSALGYCGPGNLWYCTGFNILGNTTGLYTSVAMSAPGKAYTAAYSSENYNFMYFRQQNGSLSSVMAIDTTGSPGDIIGEYNSLKFDENGDWNVAYYRAFPQPNQLRFAHQVKVTGNCGPAFTGQCDVIESGIGVGAYASLDMDGLNTPYIAYAGVNGVLRLAHRLASGTGNCGPSLIWSCTTIDASADVGSNISLYVPKCILYCTDTTRIAYYDITSKNVMYAHPYGAGGNCGPSNTWQCDVIANAGYKNTDVSINNMGVSLGVHKGVPTIAYVDATGSNSVVKLARPASGIGNCGMGGLFYMWQCDTIDNGERGQMPYHNVGAYSALAINSAGLASIAYYDATSGDLDLAQERLQLFLPVLLR